MEEATKPKKSLVYQALLSCIANLNVLGGGMSLGFSAVALPYMKRADSPLVIDEDQASWVASLASLATPLGSLLSGHLLDVWGRRAGLLVINIPFIAGWLLIGLSPSLFRLYAGRVLTGIGTGFCSIPATVYTAEIVDSSIRGIFIMGTAFSTAAGVVIVYILGAALQWQLVALICAVIPIITGIMVFFLIPESPVWLMAKNRTEGASKALMRINKASNSTQVQEELATLSERAQQNQKRTLSFTSFFKAMSKPEAYKPFIIVNTYFLFQQITGIFIIIFYAVDIVLEAGVKTDPFIVAIIIGVLRLIFISVAAFLSKTFGRRPPSLFSGIGMMVSMLVLAIHVYLQPVSHSSHLLFISSNGTNLTEFNTNNTNIGTNGTIATLADPTSISYLPLSMLFLYIVSATLGFLTLPWSMIGEVYPSQIRGIAGGLTTCIAYAISFVVLKVYPFMKSTLANYGLFCFYGIMALFGTLFVLFFLPETEGKTLQEIEMLFGKKGKVSVPVQEEEVALDNTKKTTIVKSPQR